MDIKELSIGHVIMYDRSSIILDAYHLTILEGGKEPFLSRFTPKPISEHLLEHVFDFYRNTGHSHYQLVYGPGLVFILKKVEDGWEYTVKKGSTILIKHCHELQGLYFTITRTHLVPM